MRIIRIRPWKPKEAKQAILRFLKVHGSVDEGEIADGLRMLLEDACRWVDELRGEGKIRSASRRVKL